MTWGGKHYLNAWSEGFPKIGDPNIVPSRIYKLAPSHTASRVVDAWLVPTWLVPREAVCSVSRKPICSKSAEFPSDPAAWSE